MELPALFSPPPYFPFSSISLPPSPIPFLPRIFLPSSKGCLERMRNSRNRLLDKYRQAGGNVPGRAQRTLLAQELMEEEWNAWHSMESCPEAVAQVRLGCVFREDTSSPLSACLPASSKPIYSQTPIGILTAFNPVSSTFNISLF